MATMEKLDVGVWHCAHFSVAEWAGELTRIFHIFIHFFFLSFRFEIQTTLSMLVSKKKFDISMCECVYVCLFMCICVYRIHNSDGPKHIESTKARLC